MKIVNSENAETTINLKTLLKQHLQIADFAYMTKQSDKDLANNLNKNMQVVTFDLQQCLPTPNLHTNVAFYKRLLWTYNLTMRVFPSNETLCYMWHEGIASRGSDQIASCIFKYLTNLPEILTT